jgi:hypothetical protein
VTEQGAIPHPRELEAIHYPLSLRILALKDIRDKRATSAEAAGSMIGLAVFGPRSALRRSCFSASHSTLRS